MRPSRRRRIVAAPWVELAAAFLAGTVKLEDALCRDRPQLFDGDTRLGARTREAIRLCRQCPALEDCATWVSSLPTAHIPGGVVGGRWRGRAGTDEGLDHPAEVDHG
ncbi:WhiB family transcriptional regulator [Mycolicibacterium sp. P9-64]|uniref:WhiB family transcriptional regulator n=1 Tax=Mycolicibacterium sp. P9-64 TaxID=2024612 RepID=UPI001565C96B|nr:WhiB family transcriptional regulator [Mycolicibacterium sp. P9-64]